MTPHASAPPRKTLRRILAFATISIGLLLFFTSFSVGGWRDTLGGILMGSALILPGAWFLWAEKNDRDRFAAYEEKLRQHVYYSGLLGPEDQPVVSGMGTPEPPRPVNRRWGLIYLGSVALFALAATVLPPTETTAGEDTTVTSTPTP